MGRPSYKVRAAALGIERGPDEGEEVFKARIRELEAEAEVCEAADQLGVARIEGELFSDFADRVYAELDAAAEGDEGSPDSATTVSFVFGIGDTATYREGDSEATGKVIGLCLNEDKVSLYRLRYTDANNCILEIWLRQDVLVTG